MCVSLSVGTNYEALLVDIFDKNNFRYPSPTSRIAIFVQYLGFVTGSAPLPLCLQAVSEYTLSPLS